MYDLMNSMNTNNALFTQCTERFCGRISNTSACTSCPWGSKVFTKLFNDEQQQQQFSLCEICLSSLSLYNWLYIGFLIMLPILFLLMILPINNKKYNNNQSTLNINKKSWILFLCCLLIHCLTSLFTIYLYPPLGKLTLYHCPIYSIHDFYALLLAGSNCISEVNYPLTSLPIIYYIFSAFLCSLIYSLLFIRLFNDIIWLKYLYYVLYTYPILCMIIIIFSGILYYIFPYILLFYCLIDSLYRFPLIFDYCYQYSDGIIRPICNPLMLINKIFYNPVEYFLYIIMNSLCIMYALLSLSVVYYWCLLLSLLPITLYIITLPLTHPFHYHDCDSILSRMCITSFNEQFQCNDNNNNNNNQLRQRATTDNSGYHINLCRLLRNTNN
ncbi:JNK1 MAPK8-associated membrane [Schistosoma japonicum]|uniref:JNK1 MAPK8-associated membrane n=1 Tax=Schistosoma japonicum TaxID=6182 RepID=A0A4Z2CXH8_SCHJA|nr:JNK1 MAPK8-associated membrane [Schistosoma japonicum]